MTTSATSVISEILEEETISLSTLSYFRDRLRDRCHELVLKEFLRQATDSGFTKAQLARRISKDHGQINRLLGAPGNWTLDTVSDLLLALGTELAIEVSHFSDQPIRNLDQPAWLIISDRNESPILAKASTDTSKLITRETHHDKRGAKDSNYYPSRHGGDTKDIREQHGT